jgi:PAS domain S-box-containing protein
MTSALTEQLALAIIESAPDAMVVVDELGVISFVNAQSEALFGYRREELIGQPVETVLPVQMPKLHRASRAGFPAEPVTRRTGEITVALMARTHDARELPVDVSISPVLVGESMYAVAAVRDASERRRTEAALRGVADYTRAAIDQAPDAMFTADLDGRYTDVNAAACGLLGYRREELIGKTIQDLIPPEDAPRLLASRQRMLTPGQTDIDEWRMRRKDGTMVPVEVNANILPDGRWQAIVRDVSARKHVESLLSLHAILVDRMAEGLVLVRASDARIVYTNPRFDQLLGYQRGELNGRPIATLAPEDGTVSAAEATRRIIEKLEAKRELTLELRNVRKDGSVLWCRARVIAFEHPELGKVWLAVYEDMTEQRQAEQAAEKMRGQLALADRMASLGTLAAGVAHEINNPLTYVIANLALTAEGVRTLAGDSATPQQKELIQLIEEARQGAESVSRIVHGLQALSRGGDEHRMQLDLREVLESAIRMTFHELRQKARLVKAYRPVPSVWADEGRLAQVFVNLLVNAAQAIPAGDTADNEIRVSLSTGPDGQAVVEIRDTGVGIPVEVLGRVFDPFFTTKAVGQGTGLGLSISHNIVSALGGNMEVESAVGRGSLFRVTLPPGAPTAPAPAPAKPAPVGEFGPAKVLIVDDDPLVAQTLRRALREHDVTTAANGRQALELLGAAQDFDVVVCDLMMPVMTGMELHAVLARERPDMAARMVFITGGAFTPAARAFLNQVPNPRLDKPFSSDRLRAAVRDVMANRQS